MRRTSAVAAGLLITAALLGGCGGQSTPAPLSAQELLPELMTSFSGNYVSVLTATGHGTHRFGSLPLPRHIAVELSCRGGRVVQARINGRDWVDVGCAPGQAGGGSETFGPASTLTIAATSATRWSVVVAARRD